MSWPMNDKTMSVGEREMVSGFIDGSDRDAPRPSGNRTAAYTWGFLNALRDRGEYPRHRSADRARRVAAYLIKRVNRTAE